jgi:hypothetical protein
VSHNLKILRRTDRSVVLEVELDGLLAHAVSRRIVFRNTKGGNYAP